jgi:hypothetical protein
MSTYLPSSDIASHQPEFEWFAEENSPICILDGVLDLWGKCEGEVMVNSLPVLQVFFL